MAPPASGEGDSKFRKQPLRTILTHALVERVKEEAPLLVRQQGFTHPKLMAHYELSDTQWKRLLRKHPDLKENLNKCRRLRHQDLKTPSQLATLSAISEPISNLLLNESDLDQQVKPLKDGWKTAYLQHLRNGLTRTEALDLLGVFPSDLLEAQSSFANFRSACDNERLRTMFEIEDNSMRRALEDKTEAKMFLQAYFPAVFRSPTGINIDKSTKITNNTDGPLNFNFDPAAIAQEARSIEAATAAHHSTKGIPAVASMEGRSWVRPEAENEARDWMMNNLHDPEEDAN